MAAHFPSLRDPTSRAQTLLRRVRAGEIHLVLACDRMPPGISDWIDRVSRQSSLPYEFRVVEIVPHVRKGSTSPVILVPNLRLETHVVSRTVVEIRRSDQTQDVQVLVQTPDAAEVAAQLEVAKNRGRKLGSRKPVHHGALLERLLDEVRTRLCDLGVAEARWTVNRKFEGDTTRHEQFHTHWREAAHLTVLRLTLDPLDPDRVRPAVFIEYSRDHPDPDLALSLHEVELRQMLAPLEGLIELDPGDCAWRRLSVTHEWCDPSILDTDEYFERLAREVVLFESARQRLLRA